MQKRHVVILGSGCSGLTAAIYCARAGLQPLVIEGREAGGQLSMTTLVENFPGFPSGIQGPELVENMREQAQAFGTEFATGDVTAARLGERPFTLHLEDNPEPIQTEALIIASGARARWLDLPSEQALIGHGVSSCATCDGFFFRDKDIIVVGGGDSAMEEALFLTRFASSVTIVHRRDEFRASKIMLDRAREHAKIKWITGAQITEVLDVAKKEVTGVRLRSLNGHHPAQTWDMPISAVFLGIGHEPNTRVFRGQLATDADGYLITRDAVFTEVAGVYAAGDVQDRRYRQAITAAGSGCMAAMEAERFLQHGGH
ncbi:MAG TPA: thioredoxin-disulfide reductase [Terriglobales bacterium]|nr:thioredoxin-disulfide reductase [Terriglobales bacterium]